MNRRLFFGTIVGAFVSTKVAPKPVYGYSGGAHIGSIVGALGERHLLARSIAAARWKWAVLGNRGSSLAALDPSDRRDLIVYQAGEWHRDVHTDEQGVRIKVPLDEDIALRILGVDPVEATKSITEA